MIRTKNSLASLIFCITILVAAGILGWGNRSQASPKVVWEYKMISVSNNDPERPMNELGADGWEFVQFTKNNETSGYYGHYFFRRSK